MSEAASKTPPLKHVGIILDGNRRWAKDHGLKTLEGHQQGAEVFKTIALAAFERGIPYLSAYVFSTENHNRAKDEVSYLMKLVIKATEKYLDEFHKKGIRIVVLGSRDGLNPQVLKAIDRTVGKTKSNKKGTLALCFNYGGQQEIIDAVKAMAEKGIDLTKLDKETFEQFLYAPEVPPVDLLIRTSGEKRTSGFMMWRTEYTELHFADKYWPDFTMDDLNDAIEIYENRERRFGE